MISARCLLSALIKKAAAGGDGQTVIVKGSGYELDPLVVVLGQGKTAQITFNLESFDTPEGKYQIVDGNTRSALSNFQGRKGLVTVQFQPRRTGTYGILKDGQLLGIVEVVDDLDRAELDKIREKLF